MFASPGVLRGKARAIEGANCMRGKRGVHPSLTVDAASSFCRGDCAKQGIELEAILPVFGAATPVIDGFDHNRPPISFDRCSQLSHWVLGCLTIGGDAGIKSDAPRMEAEVSRLPGRPRSDYRTLGNLSRRTVCIGEPGRGHPRALRRNVSKRGKRCHPDGH